MKQITKTKTLRRVMILTFLIVGLAAMKFNSNNYVQAAPSILPCSTAESDYFNADIIYDNSFVSVFYDNPTSCADDCAPKLQISPTAYNNCLTDCNTTRRTNLGNAGIDLLSKAASLASCKIEQPDFCENARSAAAGCSIQYDYLSYPLGSEESTAVYVQYTSCRTASGIDHCQ